MVKKLTNITSPTANGLTGWLLARVTSVLMAVYILFLLGFIIFNPGLDFYTWQSLFANLAMKVFSSLFLLSLLLHAWQGMWTVITDYVKPYCVRLLVEVAIVIISLAYLVWGILIVWSV